MEKTEGFKAPAYFSSYDRLGCVIRNSTAYHLFEVILARYQKTIILGDRKRIVSLSYKDIENLFGIKRNATETAILLLEKCGLISVTRVIGKPLEFKVDIERLVCIAEAINKIPLEKPQEFLEFSKALELGDDFTLSSRWGFKSVVDKKVKLAVKRVDDFLDEREINKVEGEDCKNQQGSADDDAKINKVEEENVQNQQGESCCLSEINKVEGEDCKNQQGCTYNGSKINKVGGERCVDLQGLPSWVTSSHVLAIFSLMDIKGISVEKLILQMIDGQPITNNLVDFEGSISKINIPIENPQGGMWVFEEGMWVFKNSLCPSHKVDSSKSACNNLDDRGIEGVLKNPILKYNIYKKNNTENPEDETGNKTNKDTSSNEENSKERSFEKEPKQLIEESDDSISVLNKYLPSYRKAEEENLENETERVVGNYSEFPYLKNFPMLSEGQRVNIARVIREVRELLPAGTEISETKLEELFNSIAEDYFDETHDKAVFDLGMDRVFVFTETVTRGLLRMYYNKSEKRDEKELMEEFLQLPKTETLSEDVLGLSDFDKADWLREKFLSTFGEGEKNQFTLSDASGFISAQMINLEMFRFRSLRYDSQDMLEELFSNKLVASDVDQKKYYVRSSRDEVVSSFSASDNKKLGIEEEITGSKIDAYEDVSDAKMLKRHNWVLEELEGLEWPETKSVVNDGVISGRAVLPVVFRKLLLNDNDEIPSTECFAICAAIRKHYGVSGYKLGGFDDLEYFIKGDYDNDSDFSVTNVNFSPSRRQRRR